MGIIIMEFTIPTGDFISNMMRGVHSKFPEGCALSHAEGSAFKT